MLKCPSCNHILESKTCPHCSQTVPVESLFCLQCGVSFSSCPGTGSGQSDEFDPENRVLCPDGTCTGIIENGKCTACGKPYSQK